MSEKKKKYGGQHGELMRVLDITPEDIAANDAGYISEHQREVVNQREGHQRRQYILAGIVMALIAVVFMGVSLIDPDDVQVWILLSSLMLSLSLFLGGFGFVMRQQLQNELNKGKVATVQGIAVVVLEEDKQHLEINGQKLKANPDVLRRVKHLDPYVIHYLPNSKTILSMQPLSEDGNLREDIAAGRLADSADTDVLDYIDDEQQQSASQ